MSKTIILIFGLLACAFAVTPLEQIKSIVQNDECGMNAM
jgi:hypothetical protein